MTFEELMGVAHAAVRKAGRSTEFSDRVMVRAVVTALRDELSKCDWDEGENMIDALNEILASDGVEAAGGDNSGEIVASPAAAPSAQSDVAKAFEAEMRAVAAPDVCVWAKESNLWTIGCDPLRFPSFVPSKKICKHCKRPISFKSEAAR